MQRKRVHNKTSRMTHHIRADSRTENAVSTQFCRLTSPRAGNSETLWEPNSFFGSLHVCYRPGRRARGDCSSRGDLSRRRRFFRCRCAASESRGADWPLFCTGFRRRRGASDEHDHEFRASVCWVLSAQTVVVVAIRAETNASRRSHPGS